MVLVDGRITEVGTHEELLRRERHYWSLYMAGGARARGLPGGDVIVEVAGLYSHFVSTLARGLPGDDGHPDDAGAGACPNRPARSRRAGPQSTPRRAAEGA